MPAPRVRRPASPGAAQRALQLCSLIGAAIRDERARKQWTLRELSRRSGLSVTRIQAIEAGAPGSIDAYTRLAAALGLRLGIELVDPRSDRSATQRQVDVIHAAMGELEAVRLRGFGFPVGIDEPYQHFQFAGRADVCAWDLGLRALLHIENRTRSPNFQEAAGRYNAKRQYLGVSLAQRLGIGRWASETHVMVGLWSGEFMHALRIHPASFRAICPDPIDAFVGWWAGKPPATGRTSALILLDPGATSRQRQLIDLEDALTARPRYHGYADVVTALSARHKTA